MGDLIGFPPSKGEVITEKHLESVKRGKKAVYVVNQKRFDEMKKAYEILCRIFCTDATVEMECHVYNRGLGKIVVNLETYDVKTDDMPWLLQAIKLADKFSIWSSLTDESEGKVEISLFINDIAIRI